MICVNGKKVLLIGVLFFMINCANALDKSENKTNFLKTDPNNYLIETGSKDYERLRILNEIVNPYSIQFLEHYIKPGDKVLEVGCGIGLMSQEIAKIVGEKGIVLGTDLNADQLAIAENIASKQFANRLEFKKASVYNLSEIKDAYDVVYVRFLFIHLDDVVKALNEIKSLLRPGGILLVEELAGNDTIASDPADVRLAYVKKIDDLQEELQNSNFSISKSVGGMLKENGFELLNNTEIHPKLDTTNKRRIFSLGMKSLENSLVKSKKISKEHYQSLIMEVEKMEKDHSIDLYFYKIGQLAARLK